MNNEHRVIYMLALCFSFPWTKIHALSVALNYRADAAIVTVYKCENVYWDIIQLHRIALQAPHDFLYWLLYVCVCVFILPGVIEYCGKFAFRRTCIKEIESIQSRSIIAVFYAFTSWFMECCDSAFLYDSLWFCMIFKENFTKNSNNSFEKLNSIENINRRRWYNQQIIFINRIQINVHLFTVITTGVSAVWLYGLFKVNC